MKNRVLLTLPFAFISLLCGCNWNGEQSTTIKVVAEPSAKSPWFIGCWSAEDGSILYISDIEKEIPDGYKAHLFIKRKGEEIGSYDVCRIYDKGNNQTSIGTTDEYDYDKDIFVADKERNQISDEFRSNLVFHRDASIVELVSNGIVRANKQKEIDEEAAEAAERQRMTKQNRLLKEKYDWIFGEWRSKRDEITISIRLYPSINEIRISWLGNDSYPFDFNDGMLHVEYGEEVYDFFADAERRVIVYKDYDDNVVFDWHKDWKTIDEERERQEQQRSTDDSNNPKKQAWEQWHELEREAQRLDRQIMNTFDPALKQQLMNQRAALNYEAEQYRNYYYSH